MKFKVGDKVALNSDYLDEFKKGQVVKITKIFEGLDGTKYCNFEDEKGNLGEGALASRFEPKRTKNQRITALEKEVDELKVIVHQLRESNITIEDVKRHFNIETTPSIVEDKPKTPNQLRAEIIEKAKGFVDSKFIEGNMGVGKVVYGRCGHNSVEFVINSDKRTVVALLKLAYVSEDGVISRGIAKCNPSDVFNEDIGKAIALGRALGLDVSEFEQAVQPTEVVKGAKIEGLYGDLYNVTYVNDEKIGTDVGVARFFHKRRFETGQLTIINDTNAIYGGVE